MLVIFLFNQGSIQGRDEFADGLAKGVESLMGNTVGKNLLLYLDVLCSCAVFCRLVFKILIVCLKMS